MCSMSWKETSIELTVDKLSSDAFGMSSWTRSDTGHTYTVEVLGGIPQDRLRVLMTHKKRGPLALLSKKSLPFANARDTSLWTCARMWRLRLSANGLPSTIRLETKSLAKAVRFST